MSTHLCSLRVLVVTLGLSFTCALYIPSNQIWKYDSQQRYLENIIEQLYQSLIPTENGEQTFKEVLEILRPFIRPKMYILLRKNAKGTDNANEIPQQRYQKKLATKQKKVSISENELQSFFSEDRDKFGPHKPISLKIVKIQRFPDTFESFPTFDRFKIPSMNGKPHGSWDALPVEIPVNEEQLNPFEDTSVEDPFEGFPLGDFINDRRDCDNIKNQPCDEESDCICNGFYTCRAGRCEPKSPINIGGSSPAVTPFGTWHDLLIDKRDRP
ncbi:uncharacterized protein LOC131939464 [Physella acuta]|uniref:uncharacterized protein LOC131939464 n=1 Tax=Physella acuta TaxID=109671 RepID=UPI0027DCA225|nr:uncharacterized protein LOC131939464 [Physella acuta]